MKRGTALALLALCLLAQSKSGIVTGKVNAGNVPVSVERDGKTIEQGVTNADGRYRFALPAGNYVIRAGKDSRSVSVVADKTLTVNFADEAQFFDEPQFTVAGVTDNTYRGGHGSDNVLRSSETLTKDTALLGAGNDDVDPHHARAEAEERAGHAVEAAKEFQMAAELNPSERNLFDWGTELLSHLAPRAAVEVFAKGSQLFPHSARMVLGKATAFYAAGDYQRAAHCFFEAIDMDPNDSGPYRFLFNAQAREVTETDGYQERFARFAQLQPSNAQANYYYGFSVWEQGNKAEEARRALQKAVRLDPHLAAAYVELGKVDAAQGEYPAAIEAYKRAIDESPSLEEAHYRLSEAYRVTGNSVDAAEEMRRFRELSKESAEKVERERQEVQRFVVGLKGAR